MRNTIILTQIKSEFNEKYEEKIRIACISEMDGRPPTTLPIVINFQFLIPIRKDWSKKKIQEMLDNPNPVCQPDINDLEKSLLDGMDGIVFVNKSQICKVKKSKYYIPEEYSWTTLNVGELTRDTKCKIDASGWRVKE